MTTKSKILAALNCTLDDLDEGRLLDILLDAYKRKQETIEALAAENAAERERLDSDLDAIRRERRRMMTDPTYGAEGEYYFYRDGRWFVVRVRGRAIAMFERRDGVDLLAEPVPLEKWAET